MSKYYKLKRNRLKVKFIEGVDEHGNMFNGIVVDPTATLWQKGEFAECLSYKDYEPYTPTPEELSEWGETATLTSDNPKDDTMDDKDVNLRLECLKLAYK